MIFLGKIVKVRGIKGEVVIVPSPGFDVYTPKKGEIVEVQSAKYQRDISIDYFKEVNGAYVLKFQDSLSINDALKLVGYSVFSKSDDTRTDDSLLEFTVTDLQGQLWGTVKDLQASGLNQLLEVEDPDGDVIYVPFSDKIVKTIDREKKKIVIDPPDGLKELNKFFFPH